jgi:hypothetical protein
MATKTFKIGEYCRGGIIQAIAIKDKVTIIGKQWDHSAGSRKSSNQSNAKEWTRLEVNTSDQNARRELDNFLNDLTSSYYSDEILKWVESNTELKSRSFFGW